MKDKVVELLTELADDLRKQPWVGASASRLVEGFRDGLLVEPLAPGYRHSTCWRRGYEMAQRFKEDLS